MSSDQPHDDIKVLESCLFRVLQVVVELAPFFGGHIIGDRKHA